MRIVLAVIALTGVAHAEVGKLGDFKLGDKVKPKTVKGTVFGCAGDLYPDIDRSKKIKRVRFTAKTCKATAVAAAITKEFGAAPLTNAAGDRLWEGKKASVILSTSLAASESSAVILLVPPGAGAKRTCWADDGFAAFWTTFKTAVAGGKPEAIAASFGFPVKNFENKVKIKDAADFAPKWAALDATDIAGLGSGKLAAKCDVDDERYKLRLDDSYAELTATKVKGTWHWTALDEFSPD
ncbi:MAG: hypothetical protein ABI867_43895 [Kofleriaceae bacterium]